MEGDAAGDGLKGVLPIRKVAAVFPYKMADKWFRPVFITRGRHEKMLELPGNPPEIKNPIREFSPFHVKSYNIVTVCEEEVIRSRVAVDENLSISPHDFSCSPPFPQAIKLFSLVIIDIILIVQYGQKFIKI